MLPMLLLIRVELMYSSDGLDAMDLITNSKCVPNKMLMKRRTHASLADSSLISGL